MSNLSSRWSGGLITGRSIFSAGTTNFKGATGSAATVLPADGRIVAAGIVKGTSIVGTTGISSAGTVTAAGVVKGTVLQPTTGFYFVAGDSKKFACGTYIGSGGATAAIKVSGLTTIHHVFMKRRTGSYQAAATSVGRILPVPTLAQGTVGSFYPHVFRTAATNKEINLGTGSGATYSWFAVGA